MPSKNKAVNQNSKNIHAFKDRLEQLNKPELYQAKKKFAAFNEGLQARAFELSDEIAEKLASEPTPIMMAVQKIVAERFLHERFHYGCECFLPDHPRLIVPDQGEFWRDEMFIMLRRIELDFSPEMDSFRLALERCQRSFPEVEADYNRDAGRPELFELLHVIRSFLLFSFRFKHPDPNLTGPWGGKVTPFWMIDEKSEKEKRKTIEYICEILFGDKGAAVLLRLEMAISLKEINDRAEPQRRAAVLKKRHDLREVEDRILKRNAEITAEKKEEEKPPTKSTTDNVGVAIAMVMASVSLGVIIGLWWAKVS